MERLLSEYTNLSSIPSMMDKPSVGTILAYLFVNVEVSEDQGAFKTQRVCSVCNQALKEGSLTAKNKKKHHCKFCFQAVCENCSCLKIKSSVGDKKNRVCVACFNDTVKRYFRIVIGPETVNTNKDPVEKKEFNEEKDYLALIKDQIARRKQEILDIKQEIRETKEIIKSYAQVVEDEKLRELRVLTLKEVDMDRTLEWKLQRNHESLRWTAKQAEELAKAEEDIKGRRASKEIVITWDNSIEANVLKEQIALISGLANTYKRDIDRLRVTENGESRKSCRIF